MGCLKLPYYQQGRALEVNPIFFTGAVEKKKRAEKNRLSSSIYGFNGQEKDDEVSGAGNEYTTFFRPYDPRLGRWKIVDSKTSNSKLIGWSPYHFSFNNPNYFIDSDGDIPWTHLIVGNIFASPSSKFGMRFHPKDKINKLHAGVDFSVPQGSGIRAAAQGKVIYAGNRNDGYGNQIVIDHGNGYITRYAHIRNGGMTVSEGDDVRDGQIIGEVGTTGKSTGPHLHFEIRKDNMWGEAIDPTSIFDLQEKLFGPPDNLTSSESSLWNKLSKKRDRISNRIGITESIKGIRTIFGKDVAKQNNKIARLTAKIETINGQFSNFRTSSNLRREAIIEFGELEVVSVNDVKVKEKEGNEK